MSRPKAVTKRGEIFDGALDCYVLDDDRRVVSQAGVVRLLTEKPGESVAVERGNLGRYLGRLPSRYAALATRPTVEFSPPGGGVAKGVDATTIVDILRAYDEADDTGSLLPSQRHLARNARRVLRALAGVGIVALIDEATGFQAQREAAALSFTYRAILLDSACGWDLMWPAEFVHAICRLHGVEWIGGVHPQWLTSTYEKLYEEILGKEVCAELKTRNPRPKYGTNHHQWLTPEAREVVRKQIPILIAIAEQCANKEEFWARVEHRYSKAPLQLSWLVPTRGSA